LLHFEIFSVITELFCNCLIFVDKNNLQNKTSLTTSRLYSHPHHVNRHLDNHFSILAAYYEELINILKQDKTRSICDHGGIPCNIPYRIEFLSSETQRWLASTNYDSPPKLHRPYADFIFEDRRLHQEDGKKIALLRRDLFYCHNAHTRGDLFLQGLIHDRGFASGVCKSAHPVTREREPGLITRLMCEITACRETGTCHQLCCSMNSFHLNK